MFKPFFQKFLLVFFAITITACANRGTPTGGEKDVAPPVIIKTEPENFSTNFKSKEIRIYFDEYVKLKNLQKQLIISPPMEYQPEITPLGLASKYIRIKILDTLQPNTTYAFNFGQSIVDNNEENPYPYYRYVFSTGSYIDSLSVSGKILDAKSKTPDKFVSVMLYEVDSTFTDSTIYKKKPKYITNTLDSLTTFKIDNIKAGQYKLIALKEENSNYTFQQKTDKIGFYEGVVNVPTDSLYTLKLFKEVTNFKAFRPKQEAGQKIAIGFEGEYKSANIEIQKDIIPEEFIKRVTKDIKADTLYYWYSPKLEIDSTYFVVTNKTYIDTLKHRFRDLPKDSLLVKSLQTGVIEFSQDFEINGSVPFASIDVKQINIVDKDSVVIPFSTTFNEWNNTYAFKFNKTESNTYKVRALPSAFKDLFGNTNDTLNYSLRTKSYSDYSNIRVTINNAVYPLIVQLTNDKGDVKYEQFAKAQGPVDFRYINPGTYYLRVVFDTNENQVWDTGSYLKKLQPERISYFPEAIDARANWDPVIEFTLE
ncbi:Ig-like domain-containing protein [Geojedonia litorea]|uniref:Ig-like domain-containing protein n=1 Tax=Geojedonia litorea TaxID=1268269 RepID=A0ABV9N853_9FLAO